MPASIVTASASKISLDPAPIPDGWIIDGTPHARAKLLAHSADRTSFTVTWSCTAGKFNWYYEFDETLHIVSGEVFVTGDDGREYRLGPGDMAFFPAGCRSIWRVPSEVHKFAVCRLTLPWPLSLALRGWRKIASRMSASDSGGRRGAKEGALAAP